MAAVNTISKVVKLHKVQQDFCRSRSIWKGFVGGRGAGKTFVGALDLIRRARRGRTYMVGSPTGIMLSDTTFPTFHDIARDLGVLGEIRRAPYPVVQLTTGATVRFRTAEDPEKMRGSNLSGVWLDEASLMKREAFDICIACLREEGEQGWMSACFTPKGKQHWSFSVFTRPGKDTALFRARTSDNPFLPANFYSNVRGQYTSRLAAQELEGEFIDAPGALFRRDWFPLVEAASADLRKLRAWDLAATDAKKADDPDWTAGVLLGKDKENVYTVLDVRHTQSSPRAVEALIRQTAEVDGKATPIWMEQEPGASGVAVIDNYTRRILSGWNFKGERSTGDKATRAQPFAAQAEAGNVRVLQAPWTQAFLDEIEAFPLEGKGIHDDIVDASTLAFNKLALGPWRKLAIF